MQFMPPPEISVVVPAFNEEHYLPACLEALRQQRHAPAHEVIVVDNASTDATAAIARSFDVRLVSEPLRGVARARHTGFMAARAPIIASTDADCMPASDWLARIRDAFREHPEVAALGGYVFFHDAPPYIDFFPKIGRRLNVLHYIGVVTGKQPLSTQNLAVQRSAYEAIGGFDRRITSPLALDDVDLTLRLSQKGPMQVIPDLVVWASSRRYVQEPVKTLSHRLANYATYALHGHGVFADHPSNVR